MYHLGHHIKHRRWPYLVGGGVLLLCLVASVVWASRFFISKTILNQSRPVTHYITATNTTTQHIVEHAFTVDIPSEWHAVPSSQTIAGAYGWQGVSTDGSGRRLDVYIDTVSTTLAANRVLPVQVVGNGLQSSGAVSDNCAGFADKSKEAVSTATAPATWNGVPFVCDLGNYERDVVLLGTSAGLNDVVVKGSTTGSHHVMLVYTDDSITPDYSVFTAIARSFQAR